MDWVGQLILTYYPMMQTMFQGHQSCGSCKEGLKGIHYLKIVCEHDQEIPQSQTADHEIISTVILLPSADLFKKGCCQLRAKVCAQITG